MRSIVIVLAFLLVAGCSSPTKLVESRSLVERSPISIPELAPASQMPLEWSVITRDNMEAKFKELENSGSVVVFALTPNGYQTMSLNHAELRRYIQQQDSVIAVYKEYYETPLAPAHVKEKKPFWRIW